MRKKPNPYLEKIKLKISAIDPAVCAITVILACFVIVSIVGFAFSIVKPFTLDEVEEARMAEKIALIGPRTFLPASQGGGGEDLSHPLLYSYTNAVFFKLFGGSEIALRSYGVIFFIMSLAVLILLLQEAYRKDLSNYKTGLIIGVSLYILNPLLIQHSMLLNADNNISAFFILLYAYLFYRFEKSENISFLHSRLILAAVVALNFMCKEITPCFLMASVILYRLINKEYKKLLYDVIFNIGLGLVLFWAIWSLYCKFTGTDVMAFIKFTAARKTKKAVNLAFLVRQCRYFFVIWKWPFYWASAPFFVALFIGYYEKIKESIKMKVLDRDSFLYLSSAVMFIPFIFIKPSIDMMKYQYPCFPVFIFIIARLIVKNCFYNEGVINVKAKDFIKGVYLALGIILIWSFWYYKIGDYILPLWNRIGFKFFISYYLPILAGLYAFYYLFKSWGTYKAVLCGLFILIFPINIGLNLSQTADYTTAECWLNYGEKGLRDTVKYLKDHVDPKLQSFVRKDIGYYLNYRYDKNVVTGEPYHVFKMGDEAEIRKIFEANQVQFFVFDKVSAVQRANPRILEILIGYFFVDRKIGDFIILRRKFSLDLKK